MAGSAGCDPGYASLQNFDVSDVGVPVSYGDVCTTSTTCGELAGGRGGVYHVLACAYRPIAWRATRQTVPPRAWSPLLGVFENNVL